MAPVAQKLQPLLSWLLHIERELDLRDVHFDRSGVATASGTVAAAKASALPLDQWSDQQLMETRYACLTVLSIHCRILTVVVK